jgi:hypothetical protein
VLLEVVHAVLRNVRHAQVVVFPNLADAAGGLQVANKQLQQRGFA